MCFSNKGSSVICFQDFRHPPTSVSSELTAEKEGQDQGNITTVPPISNSSSYCPNSIDHGHENPSGKSDHFRGGTAPFSTKHQSAGPVRYGSRCHRSSCSYLAPRVAHHKTRAITRGGGEVQESRKSKALVKTTLAQPTTAADADRVAWCNPMVAVVPTAILGRCCLHRWGCHLSTDF